MDRLQHYSTRVAGEHVLDEVGDVCSLSLKSLKIVNITREPLSMMCVTFTSIHVTRDTCVNRYVSSFVNLRCLIISPHNLGDDLVENIGN